MADGIRVDSRELERALDKLAAEVVAMPATWHAVGDALLPAVRQRTPVRSGALRDSWASTGADDRASITSDLEYAWVIEAREHAVADAIAASEREVLETLESEIAKAAGRIGFEVKR